MAGTEATVHENEGDREVPVLDYIHAGLRHLAVPIDSLTPDPKNARKHDEENQANVRRSLEQFGQRLPIVVQRQGMIIRSGNNRHAQAKALGWTHIAALVCDESEAEAIAWALVDNRSSEKGASWDNDNLTENLRNLNALLAQHQFDFGLDITGWTNDEAEALMGEFDINPTGELPSLPGPNETNGLTQITFTLNAEDQQPTVKEAVERALAMGHASDPNGVNGNRNGNAIAAICEQWLAQHEDAADG